VNGLLDSLGAIGACASNPWQCFTAPLWAWATGLDWYWYAIIALVVVGVVWKLAGWPGLLALAAGAGFILGRRSVEPEPVEVPDEDPPHIRRLKQSQGVRPKPPTDSRSAFQKWIRGE
jgi:hypothetical protein